MEMVQRLELCLVTEKAETTSRFFRQIDLNIAKGKVTKLERDIAEIKRAENCRDITHHPIPSPLLPGELYDFGSSGFNPH